MWRESNSRPHLLRRLALDQPLKDAVVETRVVEHGRLEVEDGRIADGQHASVAAWALKYPCQGLIRCGSCAARPKERTRRCSIPQEPPGSSPPSRPPAGRQKPPPPARHTPDRPPRRPTTPASATRESRTGRSDASAATRRQPRRRHRRAGPRQGESGGSCLRPIKANAASGTTNGLSHGLVNTTRPTSRPALGRKVVRTVDAVPPGLFSAFHVLPSNTL